MVLSSFILEKLSKLIPKVAFKFSKDTINIERNGS